MLINQDFSTLLIHEKQRIFVHMIFSYGAKGSETKGVLLNF